MNRQHLTTIALAVSAVLGAAVAFGEEPTFPADAALIKAPSQKEITQPHVARAALPAIEEEFSGADSGMGRLLGAVTNSGTNLTPPVTITYNGSSNAVTINDSGTGRGLSSTISNSGSGASAVYGETKGNSAGVKGVASGSGGIGGIFQVTDSASAQPALSAATNGSGTAIVAQITKVNSTSAAIVGSNTVSSGYGTGVQGYGGNTGVLGYGTYTGVYGYTTNGYGVSGFSPNSIGVLGDSGTSYGVYGVSSSGDGVYGASTSGDGVYGYSTNTNGVYANSYYSEGLVAHSYKALALYASSDSGYGVWGQSKNQFGVIGEDSGSGVGVYGSSASGYAGYFAGKVGATSFVTVSDRNAKTAFAPVSGADVLERVTELPITSWTFKGDASHRHLGPMAQDFHAAFKLNGDDDTHINLADAAGVSLAAIQELSKQLKQKDAQIAELQARVSEMKTANAEFAARMAKLEQRMAAPGAMTASLRVQEVVKN